MQDWNIPLNNIFFLWTYLSPVHLASAPAPLLCSFLDYEPLEIGPVPSAIVNYQGHGLHYIYNNHNLLLVEITASVEPRTLSLSPAMQHFLLLETHWPGKDHYCIYAGPSKHGALDNKSGNYTLYGYHWLLNICKNFYNFQINWVVLHVMHSAVTAWALINICLIACTTPFT